MLIINSICNPIVSKAYQAGGGAGGATDEAAPDYDL